MAVEAITDRPPYVIWEMRGKEDRAASIKAGHLVEIDVPYAVITRPGSRDTLEKEAEVWLEELKKSNMVPHTWYPAFKASYENWKKGETGVVNGTPIKGWPAIGSAAQRTLLASGIQTVEDLANMPDQDLQNVGTGALGFKQKARAWIEAATGPGKMAEKQAAQEAQIAQLIELTKTQAKAIEELKAAAAKTTK